MLPFEPPSRSSMVVLLNAETFVRPSPLRTARQCRPIGGSRVPLVGSPLRQNRAPLGSSSIRNRMFWVVRVRCVLPTSVAPVLTVPALIIARSF